MAAIAGEDVYAGSENYSYYPAGCFRHTVSGKFYWNTHSVGANNSFAQPLCAGAPPARTAAVLASGLSVRSKWVRARASSYGTRVLSDQVTLEYSTYQRYSGTQDMGGTQEGLGHSGIMPSAQAQL